MTHNRTIMVIGGAGYVGSSLVPLLLAENYKVKVYDTFWYGRDIFKLHSNNKNLELVIGDIRNYQLIHESLTNVTDVIHLACISNDPSYDLNPIIGREINFDSFTPVLESAIKMGVQRFIYASSSSVYGVKEEEKVTENLTLNPLTDYSKYKALCEPILLEKTNPNFISTVVRPATICGYSPRQRLDLIVNIFANHAFHKGEIVVHGGSQFRPNLHIKDMCRAYIEVLNSEPSKIAGEIFNVGSENLNLFEIANLVKNNINKKIEIKIEKTLDSRSYRINSDKILNYIGFKCNFTVKDAVLDLFSAFSKNIFSNPLSNSQYFNIKRMQEI